MKRQIIKIDEDKCNGCGACVPACVEGAIRIVDGKARLMSERYCDGLGACLGGCPQGALSIEERDAEEFDEKAVAEYVEGKSKGKTDAEPCGCPGSRMLSFGKARNTEPATAGTDAGAAETPVTSELTQWPVQLTLVSPSAPYFKEADLLVAADCVPFAYADFHRRLLKEHALVVGCPKLDDADSYVEKLAEIIRRNDPSSLTVAHMEVPCCFGLVRIVDAALARAGKTVPVRDVTIGIQGDVVSDNA